MAGHADPSRQDGSDPALLGILALLAAGRDEEDGTPTEVMLARVGLPRAEIAKVVAKSSEAVRKVIERDAAAKEKGKTR